MSPYFSVIVPLYNCERYVGECIASLRAQTYRDFEALCVDDGSDDASLARAEEAAAGDARFRFFSLPENRGQSAARNRALDEARGEVVAFLDSDDAFEPRALELIAERFERQRLDDLYFNAAAFYEDKVAAHLVVEDYAARPAFDGIATGRELFTFFEERGQFFPHGALRAVRRNVLAERGIRFREGIIHEDLLFTFQTLVVSRRSSFLNEPIYRRRIHSGSTMAAPRRTMRNIEGHLPAIDFMRTWMGEHASELDAAFVRAMSHCLNAYLNLCAEDYLRDVTDEEKRAYLATLDPHERIAFEMDVAQRAEMLREFYESRTWKAGLAVTALPRAVRDAIGSATRTRATATSKPGAEPTQPR